MKKSKLLELLDKIPDDYEISFEADIRGNDVTGLKYDQYDINERAKRLYIMLYK